MSESQRAEFEAAIEAATATPDNEDLWDEVEGLASDLESPDEVAAAYRQILTGASDPELANMLGERAARFHEEWFGEDPAGLAEVLEHILKLDPGSDWAFQKLTVAYTVGERWDALFSLYDRTLEAETGKKRKAQLLEEAYQTAKDLANAPDRSIQYLKELLALKKTKKLAAQLEKLLERHERWRDLIELWEDRLHELSDKDQISTRLRIAAIWFDNLDEPNSALDTIQAVLAETEDDADACALLERIITTESTPRPVRDKAINVLKTRYEATDRQREIVRALEAAMPFVDEDTQKKWRRDMGRRLGELDDHDAAFDHYAAVLKMDPGAVAAQRSLGQLAQQTENFARYAAALAEAAEVCTDVSRKVALLEDAARTRIDVLEDESGAIELFATALNQEGIGRASVLTIGRRLNELLARSERSRERLEVLGRMAAAETVTSSRRAIIGDVARLAEELGEADRAIESWQSRLELDASDLVALDALVALLEREQRWEQLVDGLRKRVEQNVPLSQKRADLVRIARVFEQLGDADQALAAWMRVKAEFGEDSETVAALTSLLSTTERWQELAELLERASSRQTSDLTERLWRLGDAYREYLGSADRAADCYRRVLNVDPRNEQALLGAVALLEDEATRGIAADGLTRAYRETQNWTGFLDLVETRLGDAQTEEQRLHILREAAEIQEQHGEDLQAALGSLARAFPLAPKDRLLEDNLVRLARATGGWQIALDAYRQAGDAVSDDTHTLAQLKYREASLLERELQDADTAFTSYFMVIGIEPESLPATGAVVRIGSSLGRWAEVAAALCAYVRATSNVDESLLDTMERSAQENGGFDDMSRFLYGAIEQGGMQDRLAAQLAWRVARWHLEQRSDNESAERVLKRVIALDDTRGDAVRALTAIQRATPGPALYASLRRVSDLEPQNLDLIAEIAEVATEHLGDEEQESSLGSLLTKASAAWRGTTRVSGERDPKQCVEWTVAQLGALYRRTGKAHQALDLLVEASRLPFEDKVRRQMRQRAAQIAADELGDTAAAIEMYRAVLAQSPDDPEAIDKLAQIYQREDKMAELLALRRQELSMSPPAERRLGLRLELAHIIGEIENRGGRLEVLRANLEEQPGHEDSINALVDVLNAKARHDELVDLLWDQAKKLEQLDEGARAARLWGLAAEVAENRAHREERAIEAYRRVVTLLPTPESLDSLARLYMKAERPTDAVPWLQQRLAASTDADKSDVAVRLANAHLGANEQDRAVGCLEQAVTDQVASLELRTLLAALYRESETWEPLAKLLTDTLGQVDDQETMMEMAREAASIYTSRLHSPANAIPALEKALALAGDDRDLRVMMARGLRVAGSLDEARGILEAMIAEFGRRRSTERAEIHVELAQVARAQQQLDEALKELELAARMDASNAHTQKMVAELARENGKLDKAERSLRALLLLVRREPPGDSADAVGVSEVLFELSDIAKEKGEEESAKDLLESALEAAVQSDIEARRLRRTVLARNAPDVAVRALQGRLEQSEDDSAKAQLLADIGEVMDHHLEQHTEALESFLEAIKLTPGEMGFHDAAATLAKKTDSIKTYVDSVADVVENLRREEEAPLAARLLMRLGQVAEQELTDLERARAFFVLAEQHAEVRVDALFALARINGALGDEEQQSQSLDALTEIALSDDGGEAAQAGALYRLAEVQVQMPNLLDRGLDLLKRALDVEPRYQQAGMILQLAAGVAPDSEPVLSIYEPVARSANDSRMLLDFLERRARHASATADQVKEAVDLAVELEEPERGEALLARAVEAARESDEGLGSAVWAVVGLTERKIGAGELGVARELLMEAAHIAEPPRVQALGLSLSAKASEQDDTLDLAAEVYEFLREREPANRDVWEPLFDVYRRIDDADRLAALVTNTLPALVDTDDRNALRIRNADFLISSGRSDDAIEILRDALLDDPDNLEASAKLEDVLVSAGDDDGLADFLSQRFEDAKERRNPETVADVALRLGALLERIGSDDVITVYKDALEIAPENPDLLRSVISKLDDDSDPNERASLMERQLDAEGEELAGALALDLCALYESLEDWGGAQRALELGFRTVPDDTTVRDKLESWYRERELWQALAGLIATDAQQRTENPDEAVARFRESAQVYRDNLGDLHSAGEVLRKALAVAPSDASLVAELAACLVASGDTSAAAVAIGEALSGELPSDGRVALLLSRSDLRMSLGQEDQAIEDLEEAFSIDREMTEPLLINGLHQRRASAQSQSDVDTERRSTVRLAELYQQQGEEESARNMLLEWIRRAPSDREVLVRVRDMDTEAGRWDGVVEACTQLAVIDEGDDQLDAGMRLAHAAETCENPGAARQGLESVYQAQPDNQQIRDLLRRVYEATEANWELAHLLIRDAESATDTDTQYSRYRSAADILVNKLGNSEAALAPAQKAQELKPEDHGTVILLADVLTHSGHPDQAAQMLDPAIAAHKRRSPELAALQHRMAKVFEVTGDRDSQLQWLKKAFDVDRKDGVIAAELAHLATELGDYDLALKPLRAITLMDSPGPVTRVMALLWEAKIEHARGNRAKAELWAKKALREDPNYAEAQEFLAALQSSP